MRIFLILVLAFFCSCKKNLSDLPFEKLHVSTTLSLRDVKVFNNSDYIVCGGDNGKGVVLKTTDGGMNWQEANTSFGNQVNSINFLNDSVGFCADSDILIYKTVDGGINWNPFYATSWPLTVNRHLRDIWFTNDSTGYVCGGKNLGNGVLFTTADAGNYWGFNEYAHEYRGICFKNESNGILCGYGSLMQTTDGGRNFKIIDNGDHYYTGICLDNLKNYWMCDFNGGVYTSAAGDTWDKKRDSNNWNTSGPQLNCIAVSPTGHIACAGPNGFITWSTDNGTNWNDRESFGGNDILSVAWVNDDVVVAVGKDGGA
jgi:photosystem II stability/assembly factor-like uncharacterized protein